MSATVDRSGGSVFVWRDSRGLLTRARPRRGTISPTRVLTPAPLDSTPVAGNAAGEALAGWSARGDRGIEIAALRPSGGQFGAPQTLLDAGTSEHVCNQDAAISDSGEALVVFSVVDNGARDPFACRVYAAARAPGEASFAPAVQLSDATGENPHVALDARGNGLIAWGDRPGSTIKVVRHPAGGGFGPAQTIAVPGERAWPGIQGPLLLRVSARTGRALIAFPTLRPPIFARQVGAAIGTTTGGFGRAARLSGPADLDRRTDFTAGAGADGTLAVAWRGGSKQHRHIQIARAGRRASSMSRDDGVTLPGNHAVDVALAISDKGRTTVAWTRRVAHGKRRAVEVASAAPSRRFSKPQLVSANGSSYGAAPQLQSSSTGAQYLTWLERVGRTVAVHWASASPRGGRFDRARRLNTEPTVAPTLFRGSQGAMLALVEGVVDWELFTYGER